MASTGSSDPQTPQLDGRDLRAALEGGNVAVGTLGGAAALCAGLINAACVF